MASIYDLIVIGTGVAAVDYIKAEGKDWVPVPEAGQRAFPPIETILREKVVPSPLDFSK